MWSSRCDGTRADRCSGKDEPGGEAASPAESRARDTVNLVRGLEPVKSLELAAAGGSTVVLDPRGRIAEANEQNNLLEVSEGTALVCP